MLYMGLKARAGSMKGACAVPGCDEPQYGLGWCKRHHKQFKSGLDPRQLANRSCKYCGKQLGLDARPDQLYCSRACRMGFHHRYGCYTDEAIIAAGRICSVDGCGRATKAKSLCQTHYNNLCRRGDPLKDPPKFTPIPCKIAHCTLKSRAKGFCDTHYRMNRRHRDRLHGEHTEPNVAK